MGDGFFFAGADLGGLIFAGIVRDTRGRDLSAAERINAFPASPLCAVTWVFDGAIHLGESGPALPRMFVSGPLDRPLASYSPGAVRAMTVGFYPDAFRRLTGLDPATLAGRHLALAGLLDGALGAALQAPSTQADPQAGFALLQQRLAPLWQAARGEGGYGRRLADWSRALAARLALAGHGAGARQLQRRVKGWTGQSMRDLSAYIGVEGVFARIYGKKMRRDLAGLAAEAGYADQSHMGREVRRVTGAPPARIARLIAEDERYWCYRLIGTHLSGDGAEPD